MIVINRDRELELTDFFNSLTKHEQDLASRIFAKAIGAENVTIEDTELMNFHGLLNDSGKACMYDLSLCALGVAVTESALTKI